MLFLSGVLYAEQCSGLSSKHWSTAALYRSALHGTQTRHETQVLRKIRERETLTLMLAFGKATGQSEPFRPAAHVCKKPQIKRLS